MIDLISNLVPKTIFFRLQLYASQLKKLSQLKSVRQLLPKLLNSLMKKSIQAGIVMLISILTSSSNLVALSLQEY